MRLHNAVIGLVWLNLSASSIALANDPPPGSTVTTAGPARVADPGQEAKDKAPSSTATVTADGIAPPSQPVADSSAQPGSDHPAAVDLAEDRHLRSMGYKSEMRNGTPVYCRRESPIGSRLDRMVCITAEQSKSVRQNSKDHATDAQQRQLNPVGH